MSTENNSTKPEVPAWRRLVLLFALFALFMLVLLVGVTLFQRSQAIGRLTRIMKALDETEPGWRWDGLLATRAALKPEENSVPRILEIVRFIPRGWPDNAKWDAIYDIEPNILFDEQRRRIFSELATTAPLAMLRTKARELERFPRGRIELIVPENPYTMLLPDHQKMREIARLLSFDALDSAQNGRPDEALIAARACLNVSRVLEDDPTLIGQLIRMAVAAIALGTAQRTMALGEASDQALAHLQEALKHEASSLRMEIGLKGERASTHQMFLLMASGKVRQRDLNPVVPPRVAKIAWLDLSWLSEMLEPELARREHPAALQIMNRIVAVSRLPAKDQFAAEAEIEKEINLNSGVLGSLLLPAYNRATINARRDQACAVAMRALIAVERYRLRHGQWPTKLNDTVPAFLDAVPADPIDGNPIRYAKWAEGVVVYSIGNDRTDDGGDVQRQQNDYGYRLWNKNRRRAAPRLAGKRGVSRPRRAGRVNAPVVA